MVLSDERAMPGEGIVRRRVCDFWTMSEACMNRSAACDDANLRIEVVSLNP
jgi:hypothetical protein